MSKRLIFWYIKTRITKHSYDIAYMKRQRTLYNLTLKGFGDSIYSPQWRHQQYTVTSSIELCSIITKRWFEPHSVWFNLNTVWWDETNVIRLCHGSDSRWPGIRRGHCRSGHQRKMTRMAIMRATMTTQYPAGGDTISRVTDNAWTKVTDRGARTELGLTEWRTWYGLEHNGRAWRGTMRMGMEWHGMTSLNMSELLPEWFELLLVAMGAHP